MSLGIKAFQRKRNTEDFTIKNKMLSKIDFSDVGA